MTSEQVVNIQLKLRERFPYIRFEHEAIFPISTDEHFATHFADAKAEEEQHKQRIRQETAKTQGKVSVFGFSDSQHQITQKTLTDDQYELERRNQFLRDTGQLSESQSILNDLLSR